MSDLYKIADIYYNTMGWSVMPAHICIKRVMNEITHTFAEKKCILLGQAGTQWAKWGSIELSLDSFQRQTQHLIDSKMQINGIVLYGGDKSGVCIVDQDSPVELELLKLYCDPFETIHDITKRGNHFYYRLPPYHFSTTVQGLELRSNGNLIIIPPSNFNFTYKWGVNVKLKPENVKPLPAELIKFFGFDKPRTHVDHERIEVAHERPSLAEAGEKLSVIRKAFPTPDYDRWLKISSAVMNTYDKMDAIPLLKRYYPEWESNEYAHKSVSILKNVTWGTVNYYYKEAMDLNRIGSNTPNDLSSTAPVVAVVTDVNATDPDTESDYIEDPVVDVHKEYKPIENIGHDLKLFRPIPPFADLPAVVIDIETAGLDSNTDRIFAIGLKTKDTVSIIIDMDEVVILKRFLKLFENFYHNFEVTGQKNIIVGHNIFCFDLPFILRRLEINGLMDDKMKAIMPRYKYVKDEYGRKKLLERYLNTSKPVFGNSHSFAELRGTGVDIVDTLILAALVDGNYLFQNLKLKSLAIELGYRTEKRLELTADEIKDSFYKKDGQLARYLIHDLEDTWFIYNKLFPPHYFTTSIVHYLTLQEIYISSTARKIEAIMDQHYGNYRTIKPDQKKKYRGGLTAHRRGLFKNCMKADIASQYPWAMRALDIGPGPTKDPDGYFRSTLNFLTLKRLQLKKSEDQFEKQLSNSLKILINSFYGLLGAKNHKYNNMHSAARVCAAGRQLVGIMRKVIEDNGYKIVEIDTDGIIFVSHDKGIIHEILKKMPPHLEVECEYEAQWVYVHKAKIYIVKLNDGKYILKGLFRNRKTSPLRKDFTLNLLEKYNVDPLEAERYFNETIELINSGKMPYDWIIANRRVAKNEKEVLKYANVGDVIRDYWGVDAINGKAIKVVSGDYNKEYYGKVVTKWYKEIIKNITTQNELTFTDDIK